MFKEYALHNNNIISDKVEIYNNMNTQNISFNFIEIFYNLNYILKINSKI